MQKTMTSDAVKKLIGMKAKGKLSQGRYGKRHIAGQMNQTESHFADMAEAWKRAGIIVEWMFEPMSLKYANDARFTADFLLLMPDGSIELVDVKGSGPVNEASVCRAKACAEKFYFFTFSQYKRNSKKHDGNWVRTEF